jgi:hypothetical protein
MAQGLFDTSGDGIAQYNTQPQQATAPAPSTATTVASSGVLQGLGNLAEGLVSGLKAGKKQAAQTAEDAALSIYARKVTSLNAAVEQGSMKQPEAQRQQRALYNSLVANNPAVTDKLTTFSSSLSGAKGLGDTLANGTAVDQALNEQEKQATAANFITPDMTPEQKQAGLNAWLQRNHAINQMEFQSKQLGVISQKLSIQASQESIAASRVSRANSAADLAIKKNKLRTQQAVGDVAASYFDKTQNQMSQIQADVASGKMTQEAGMQELMKLKTDFNAITMKVRGAAGGDYIDSLAKPINDSIDTQAQVLSGKMSQELAQTHLEKLNIQAQLPIMSDPKMAQIMSVSKLMGAGFNTQLLAETGPTVINFINRTLKGLPAANPTSSDPEDAAQTKTFMGLVKDATKNLGAQNPLITDPTETFKEVRDHANQVLHGIADFSSSQKQPSQLNNAVDFLSSPEFLALQKMGAKFDAEAVEGATNAVTTNYNDKLIPAVRDEWRQAQTTVGAPQSVKQIGRVTIPVENQKPTTDALQYIWTGTSIQFKPAPGYETNPSVLAKARELQKKLAPLINKSVRMSAHLSGSDNYTKYFQQNEEAFFGAPETTKDVTNGE